VGMGRDLASLAVGTTCHGVRGDKTQIPAAGCGVGTTCRRPPVSWAATRLLPVFCAAAPSHQLQSLPVVWLTRGVGVDSLG
jgi:hypothetical protein